MKTKYIVHFLPGLIQKLKLKLRRGVKNIAHGVYDFINHPVGLAIFLKYEEMRDFLLVPFFVVYDTYYQFLLVRKKTRGEITHVPCLVPFTRMEFGGIGNVSACCVPFTKVKTVGNIHNGTIEDIWNGKKMQRFRRFILLGFTWKTCLPHCPFLQHRPISINRISTDSKQSQVLKEDLQSGETKLRSHPLWFNLGNWGACNLSCIMCTNKEKSAQILPRQVVKTLDNLKNYFDSEITMVLTGNGDPLARSDTRELLFNFQPLRFPKVRFEILTNGLLFTRENWEKIKHCHFTWCNISLDAATKETYGKIRKKGDWEVLMKNLQVFKEAKEQRSFSHVVINMTVMRSNYKEIPLFIEMARKFGFLSYFSIIRGTWDDENFFGTNDRETIEDLRRVLSTPTLYNNGDVDLMQLSEYIPAQFRWNIYNHLTHMAYSGLLDDE